MLRALLASVCLVALAGCDGTRPSAVDGSVMPDAAAVDASAAVDAGDLPICPSPSPLEGSPCTAGDGCWIPGSPCFFVYRCEDSMWSPRTICPSADAGP